MAATSVSSAVRNTPRQNKGKSSLPKPNMFEEQLEKLMAQCGHDCNVCYKLFVSISKHIRETHSRRIHDDPIPGPSRQLQNENQELTQIPGDHDYDSSVKTPKTYSNLRKRKAIDYSGLNIGETVKKKRQSMKIVFVIPECSKCEPEPQPEPQPEPTDIDIKSESDPLDTFNEEPVNDDLDEDIVNEFDLVNSKEPETICEVKKNSKKKNDNVSVPSAVVTKTRKNTKTTRKYTAEDEYKCEECDASFKRKQNLQIHKRRQHNNNGQCGICQEEFSEGPEELTDHIKKNHQEVLEKLYNCMICDYMNFSKASELNEHFTQIHPNNLPYPCKYCKARFFLEFDLNRHVLIHHADNSYKCEYCDKSYKNTLYLRKHIIMTHTKEKPYKCQSCKKCYNLKEHLEEHEKVHF